MFMESLQHIEEQILCSIRRDISELPTSEARALITRKVNDLERLMRHAQLSDDGNLIDEAQRQMLDIAKYLASVSNHDKQ